MEVTNDRYSEESRLVLFEGKGVDNTSERTLVGPGRLCCLVHVIGFSNLDSL
jgi:hypothetical protein